MKWFLAVLILLSALLQTGFVSQSPQSAAPAFLGEKAWTTPTRLKVRSTSYALDGKTSSGIKPRYATGQVVGSAAVPYWIPRGSLIRTQTNKGPRVYLALDQGPAVEAQKAARKSGKTAKQRRAPVIDFCAPAQQWKDHNEVEIFQYIGTTPFDQLTPKQKEQAMAYAQRFIAK